MHSFAAGEIDEIPIPSNLEPRSGGTTSSRYSWALVQIGGYGVGQHCKHFLLVGLSQHGYGDSLCVLPFLYAFELLGVVGNGVE